MTAMTPDVELQKRKQLGTWLVVLQFGLLLLLAALAAPAIRQPAIPAAAWLLALGSGLLGAWTLAHNRLGNFNIRPTPKPRGVLVTSGPYRWIRHPMYTAVLLGAGALAWTSDSVPAWLACLALSLVLLLKSTLEEHWLRVQHPGYAAYCRTSKRFVPWLI